jgi:hypothetical protein
MPPLPPADVLDPDENHVEVVDPHRPNPGPAETPERNPALMTHESERMSGGSTMAKQTTITANMELVREFIGRVFNERNARATPDYFSPEVRWHGGTLGTIEGSDAMTSFYGDLFAALPDLHATRSVSSPTRTRSGAASLFKVLMTAACSASQRREKRSGGTRSTPTAWRTGRSSRSGPPPI